MRGGGVPVPVHVQVAMGVRAWHVQCSADSPTFLAARTPWVAKVRVKLSRHRRLPACVGCNRPRVRDLCSDAAAWCSVVFICINAPEGCRYGTHTMGRHTRGTSGEVHTHTTKER